MDTYCPGQEPHNPQRSLPPQGWHFMKAAGWANDADQLLDLGVCSTQGLL